MHPDNVRAGRPVVLRKAKRRTGKPNGRPPKATSAKEIARKQRIAEIMALRLQGWSLQAIGDAQSPPITNQRVGQIITEQLALVTTQSVEDVRRLEALRLDEMQIKMFEQALNGDFMAIDRVLSIMATRAKILGVNAPQKTEEVGPTADAKTTFLSKLGMPLTDEIRVKALMLFLEKAKGLSK